jgi:hypothetical protein
MPHAELAVIKGGGHLFLVSQADDTIAMIDEFLADDGAQTARKAA